MSHGFPDSTAPRYSEAYPRISAQQAWRGRRQGRPHPLWRNRHHHAIGAAELTWTSPEQVLVQPHIQDFSYLCGTTGDVTLNVVWKGSTRDNHRPYFVCERCFGHYDLIVYSDIEWWCKRCHALRNRSECIDEVIRISEKLDVIEREVGQGRPAGMRQAAYEAKREEWSDLKRKLGGRPRRTASIDYLHLVTSEWLPPGPLADHVGWADAD